MLVTDPSDLSGMLACPACMGGLEVATGDALACVSPQCAMSSAPFPRSDGKTVLVDFTNSVLDRAVVLASAASPITARGSWRRAIITPLINGTNRIAPGIAGMVRAELEAIATHRPRLLVVGGGTIGDGSEALYGSDRFDVVAFDIYASANVTFVADAHAIPLANASVDAIWVQAVLEHVAEPATVVAEMTRVLRPGGLIFADTPFLWPVHEAGYDFTRWSPSGHRWLFRNYDLLAAGTSSGPGTAALLALRCLVAGLTRSYKIGQLLTLPLVWLRLLDRWCDPRIKLDSAAGVYFYGRKMDTPLELRELIRHYDEQPALERASRDLARNRR